MQTSSPSRDLAARVAVVTGGTSGIGLAIADRLAARGARVVIAGRNRRRGETVARTLAARGDQVEFVQVDVQRERQVHALMEGTARASGGIDLVFNNAGIEGPTRTIDTFSDAMLAELIAINFAGVFWGMKHALRHLAARRGGAIVNTAAAAGVLHPSPEGAAYGATKAAVASLTRSVASAAGLDGTRLYAVCPWTADTPMTDRRAGHGAEAKQELAGDNPDGRLVSAGDVASVAIALADGSVELVSGSAVAVGVGGSWMRIEPAQWPAVEVGEQPDAGRRTRMG